MSCHRHKMFFFMNIHCQAGHTFNNYFGDERSSTFEENCEFWSSQSYVFSSFVGNNTRPTRTFKWPNKSLTSHWIAHQGVQYIAEWKVELGKLTIYKIVFKENTKICFHFSSHSLEDARHCVGIPEGLLPAFVSHFPFKQVRELSNVRRNLIWKIFPR